MPLGAGQTNNTSELVTYDGLTLNTYAYNISTGTGRYHIPDRRGSRLYLPGKSGYAPVPLGVTNEGESTWTMWVNGTNPNGSLPGVGSALRTTFESNLLNLMQIFGNRVSPRRATATQADGSVREAWCEVWDVIEPTTMAGRTRAELTVVLLIPNVYWQDISLTTQSATASATLPKSLDMTGLAGGAGIIEDAVLTVVGPIVNPRVTDSESGVWVQYTGTVPSGQSWVLDAGAATSKVNGADVTTATSHGGSPLLFIVSPYKTGQAYPTLILSGTGGGTLTNVTCSARRKHYSA